MGRMHSSSMLTVLLIVFCVAQRHKTSVFVSQPNESYDYIVVGGGSAGSVVASRLSEDPNVTVLLVEAGGSDIGDPYISTPVFVPVMETVNPGVIIHFFTEPDRNGYRGLRNGQSKWPRGRVLGGTGSINGMLYMRGSRHDFDRWAAYTRDSTWDYSHVLPYFKRSEKMLTPELMRSVYHSTDGPFGVTRYNASSFVRPKIIKGFQELGYPFNQDFNGRTMEGITNLQEAIENGERSSTSRSFLHPFLDRANLNIALNSRVQKVTINNNKAEGVELIKNGRKFLVRATREVILSAGTIETPQILILSGIGPKRDLQKLNISLVADLPVGDNLQDHTFIDVPVEYNSSGSTDSSSFLQTFLQYKLSRTGPMSTVGMNLVMLTSTTKKRQAIDWPDLQFLIGPKDFSLNTAFLTQLNGDPGLIQDYSYRDIVPSSIAVFSINLNPASRGTIKLRSPDPFDPPLIYPNYYEKQEDVETVLKGVKLIKKIVGTKAMKSVAAKLVDIHPLRICREYNPGSNEHWECVIRLRPLTAYHPVGTCKMGATNDSSAVVDPQLRVRGVKGLRVADASIMPFIVAGSTNAATVMIGEKASDFIRGVMLSPASKV